VVSEYFNIMFHLSNDPSHRRWPRRALFVWLAALAGLAMACKLLASSPNLTATQTGVVVQQTQLAQTMAALSSLVADAGASPAPGGAIVDPATALETMAALQTLQATTVPGLPESTPMPSATQDGSVVDERLLKSAKILLFEDMSASRYIRLVKKALDEAGYFYLDVGSAKGWFKTQLQSTEDWDLIIAAAEAEHEFGGEFYEYLDTRLQGGASIIIENWDLDAAPNGRAKPLLDRCGVQVQADWYMPELPVFYWRDPGLPIFNQPNALSRVPRNAQSIWHSGDLGDLMEMRADKSGDAQILASTDHKISYDSALLVSCMNGRMILQTFRSHEYNTDDMVALWQNYIYQALKARFAHVHKSVPTPVAVIPAATPAAQVTSPGPTPGPDYTMPHPCGPTLSARVMQAPVLTPDLFEHHAEGVFMVLRLEVRNDGTFPVQIWDGDYALESMVGQTKTVVPANPAATGYLYLDSPGRLYQDLVQPGETWRTALAFDIDPNSRGWLLVLRPGSEFNQQVCEVRIPLTR